MAALSGVRRPGRNGKLHIRVEYKKDIDRMVLVCCLSLFEKMRQRK